jgi:hypothetical protein
MTRRFADEKDDGMLLRLFPEHVDPITVIDDQKVSVNNFFNYMKNLFVKAFPKAFPESDDFDFITPTELDKLLFGKMPQLALDFLLMAPLGRTVQETREILKFIGSGPYVINPSYIIGQVIDEEYANPEIILETPEKPKFKRGRKKKVFTLVEQ